MMWIDESGVVHIRSFNLNLTEEMKRELTKDLVAKLREHVGEMDICPFCKQQLGGSKNEGREH